MNNIARIAKLASEQEGSESARQIIPSTDISSTTSAEIINSVNKRTDDGVNNNIVSPPVTITTTSNTNVKSNNNDVDNINKEKEVIVLDIMKQKETNNQESQDTFAQLLKATMDKQSEATIGTFLKSNSPISLSLTIPIRLRMHQRLTIHHNYFLWHYRLLSPLYNLMLQD